MARRTGSVKWVGSAAVAMMIAVACGETLAPVNNNLADGDAGPDGAKDPSGSDAGAVDDVVTPFDAPPSAYCATVDASFCWSFDKPQPNAFYANGALQLFGQDDESGMELAVGDANSPPSSYRVGVGGGGGPMISRGLSLPITGDRRHAICRLAIVIDQTPGPTVTNSVDIVKLTTNASNLLGIKITLEKIAGPNVQVQLRRDTNTDMELLLSTLPGTWLSLLFALHFQPGDGGLEIVTNVFDGGQEQKKTYPVQTAAPAIDSLKFGLMGTNVNWRVRYDDVACTFY
jgi:hypothetical protein